MIVIFHSLNGVAHCDDGFAAAWCFRKKYPHAQFWPGVYGVDPPLNEISQLGGCNETLALVDFSYKRPQMKALARYPVNLLVLDHHHTAQAELAGLVDELTHEEPGWPTDELGQFINLPDVRFDMGKSGARMAWEYCFPGERPPELLLRIEDGDLWRWQYDDSKRVQAALRSYPQTFDMWDKLMESPITMLEAEGASIRRFIEQKVEWLINNAREQKIGGVVMPVCNCPAFFASEVAGALAEAHPGGMAATYFDGRDYRGYSLRAREGADVSEIAKKYGGGGHKGAAGFGIPRP